MYGTHYKLTSFVYKNDTYPSGTKLIYNGHCFINGKETELKNQIVTWLYNKDYDMYFSTNEVIYTCPCWEFKNHIVKIIGHAQQTQNNNQKAEIYWTNDMVAKTLWYIVIMLAAVIFYDRVAIWIVATIVWYTSTFKKKQ